MAIWEKYYATNIRNTTPDRDPDNEESVFVMDVYDDTDTLIISEYQFPGYGTNASVPANFYGSVAYYLEQALWGWSLGENGRVYPRV